MATQPAAITFRTVTSKSDSAANELIAQSNRNLGTAFDTIGGAVEKYSADRTDQAGDAFTAQVNALQGPDADVQRRALLDSTDKSFLDVGRADLDIQNAKDRDNDQRVADSLNKQTQMALATSERKEDNRLAHSALLASSGDLSNSDFNAGVLGYLNQGGSDINGLLANDQKRRFKADTQIAVIPEENFITKYKVDPADPSSYNQEKYNQIISDQSDRIRAEHQGLPEAMILKSAQESVAKTSHGRAFTSQTWFENLNRSEQDIRLEAVRNSSNNKEYRILNSNVDRLYKKEGNSETYKIALAKLDAFVGDNELSKSRQDRVTNYTVKAVGDFLGDDFDVENSFNALSLDRRSNSTTGIDANGDVFINNTEEGLTLPDYNPTQVKKWLDLETIRVMDEFPGADRTTVESALLKKLGDSPAGPRIVAAAIPAQVQAAANKLEGDNAISALQNRNTILAGFRDEKSPSNYDASEFFAQQVKRGVTSDNKEKDKISKQLGLARSQWEGYFNLSEFTVKQRDTLKIAIHRVIMESFIDVDKWDPNDVAHPLINPTGDISNDSTAVKNRVLTALLSQVSPNREKFVTKRIKDNFSKAVQRVVKQQGKVPKDSVSLSSGGGKSLRTRSDMENK